MKAVFRCVFAAAMLAISAAGNAQAEGRPGDFDYYVLALSWSPSYCESKGRSRPGEPQCSGERAYSFVLHGLWPQYQRGWPQFCQTGERPWVPDGLIRNMLDIMPSKRLIINEFRKHGTCSGLNPNDYFGTARKLFERIKIPPRFQNPQDYITLPPDEIEKEFLAANPDLKPEMIKIACNRRNLGDFRICFSRDLKPTSCGAEERQKKLCSSEKIVMPPVRAGASGYDRHRGEDGDGGDDREEDDNAERDH